MTDSGVGGGPGSSSSLSGGPAPAPLTSTPQQQLSQDEPQPGPSSRIITERQNSTTSTNSRSDQEGRTTSRFGGLLDFDGNRHFQTLSMIGEWARNSVNASIPILRQNSGSTTTNPNNDTHISIPPDGPQTMPPTPTTTGNGGTALSNLPSRLARGLLSSTTGFGSRRRSDDIPELGSASVSYNQATSSTTMGGSIPPRNRDALTLDLESVTTSNNNTDWRGRREDNDADGNENGADSVPGERSGRESGQDRRPSPTGSEGGGGGGDRTPGDILRDSPETRAFIEEINQYTTLRPFLIIMLLKMLVDHGSGIISFLALIVTFSHTNSLLKKEIGKQKKRNLLFLTMIIVNLIGCAIFIYYIFGDEQLYYSLGFMATKVEINSFLTLMWVVGVTDYIAKFATIMIKAMVVALPSAITPFKKRGIYYLFIEQSSQLYRSALPVHPWLLYLVNSYADTSMQMFGFFLASMYTVFKLMDSVPRVRDWQAAFKKLFQNISYGTPVTQKELDSMDSLACPICHETFTDPTRLSCGHVFCEECVSTWFDRGMTCPMCRAKVVDDPSFRDGTTAQYIQFF